MVWVPLDAWLIELRGEVALKNLPPPDKDLGVSRACPPPELEAPRRTLQLPRGSGVSFPLVSSLAINVLIYWAQSLENIALFSNG
jgi:hypothetical protein